MPTTRQNTKDKIDAMVSKLQSIEITAIEIGMLYENSDSTTAPTMYAVSKLVEVVIPLLIKCNEEL